MPLNKLENFIKNTEGRILYVNPNDLDATDAAENQGNSLTTPFKTIQRALVEAARFSYLKGNNNDQVEKTTILLFPGEHVVDNRPGYGIKDNSGAKAVDQTGGETVATTTFGIKNTSIFDLTQEDNILYKFNSIHGGVIVPRGTSIVGLDLRKTKIRPKYVPNPTDSTVNSSAIFRVTGACYFWQFSIFDGDELGEVYTDDSDFGSANKSKPTFSHHKLTCFEYADGVNVPTGYSITDLDMYYAKLSNAFNSEIRPIDEDWPSNELGFAKQRPEWEIVGAFAADPVNISSVTSFGRVVTVTTSSAHGLSTGTPIRIKGVSGSGTTYPYNISTKVNSVTSETQFTYLLELVPAGLNTSPSASGATVTIETDTVTGASPYIFNISMRSVWGMNGMHADGGKASGFRSMVVAQFTAVSLQKDDRAFVKYNESSRGYDSNSASKVSGAELSSGSSQTDSTKVYHLDAEAKYRTGWETSHIKASNDAFVQIVSVFAIGFTRHFDARSGADYSVTNSNSNFGQLSLASSGFKKEAFNKDNTAYITSVITPKAITSTEEDVDWISIDVGLTTSVGISSHLYLYGFNDKDDKPPVVIQGYRVGARTNDKLYLTQEGSTYSSSIYMVDNEISTSGLTTAIGTNAGFKEYSVSSVSSSILTIGSHDLVTGEKIKLISDTGDVPENITEHQTYYAIRHSATQIKLASSLTNAQNGTSITIYGGTELKVLSRVSDKDSGDIGSPIQYDASNGNWFIHTETNSGIYNSLSTLIGAGVTVRTNPAFFRRIEDPRSIDEKLYKFRVVIPKEVQNTKNPEEGFVIQESSTTSNTLFSPSSITASDYDYDRNPRFISTCSVLSSTVTVVTELPHNLNVSDKVIVRGVTSTDNTAGTINVGYNGTFTVTGVSTNSFTYSTTDIDGKVHTPSTFTNDTSTRNTNLPRFERNDSKSNYYIYRSDVITPHVYPDQDGVYHLYVLNADNAIETHFTDSKFSQNVTDLYPQLDRDNVDENPKAAKTYAKRSPVGSVVTDDLKKSITRETTDKILRDFSIGIPVSSATASSSGISTITFSEDHNLSGIVTYSALAGGSGYTNGTYQNVKLFNDGTSIWDGATARVTVTGGAVVNAEIIAGGSGYTDAEELDFDTSIIGGGTGAGVTISNSGISTVVGNTIQVTGSGTTTGGYYRITGVPAKNQISIGLTSGDPTITSSQYVINVAPEVIVSSKSFSGTTSTYTTSRAHGLVSGNKVTILDSSHNNLGEFLVATSPTPTTLTVVTTVDISAKYILKHALSANNETSGVGDENLATRCYSFYDNEILTLSAESGKVTNLEVSLASSGISTTSRFEIGSYIQVEDEIMRITSSTLSGSGNNEITVIRGVFGTTNVNHASGSLVKKIKPLPIEFRRPSYVRASGHTFEYLGYGPGNYSTGLPQVQITTLSEKEEYLSQAQERDCGIVVYTGMNNDGDFFIGNKKINSATGKETNFDIPVATITGQDPSRLSEVFDETIIKERLLVEGGNSGTILSQFDGPVKFTNETRFNDDIVATESVKLTKDTDSTSTDTGALIVTGGVGIGKTLTAANATVGTVTLNGSTNELTSTSGNLTINASIGSTVAISTDVTVNGNLDLTGSSSDSGRISANYLDVPNISPIGSIMMWPGTLDSWPTTEWRQCNGAGLSTSTYSDLFNIIGYTYGGSGATFNLPNMSNLFVVGAGDAYSVNDTGGSTEVTLTETQMPSHKHDVSDSGHTHSAPWFRSIGQGGATWAVANGSDSRNVNTGYANISETTKGGNQPHENRPPYIGLYYIIRIQ